MIFDGHKLTREQQNCLDVFASVQIGETMGIQAGAGSAKTYTCRAMSKLVTPNTPTLMIVYNSPIAAEMRKQFPSSYVDVMTTHALAYKHIGYRYKSKLNARLTPYHVKNLLGVERSVGRLSPFSFADATLKTMQNYCVSADTNVCNSHIPVSALNGRADEKAYLAEKIKESTVALLKAMKDVNSSVPVTHDFYLKLFVLYLKAGHIELPYQVVMLDEAQDTTPVAQLLFSIINAKKAMVGDEHQAIYEWRGARNAMQQMTTHHKGALTTCFRFGDEIADLANRTLLRYAGCQTHYKGNPTFSSNIITSLGTQEPEQQMILYRTNAAMLTGILDSYDKGRVPAMQKKVDDLRKIVDGIGQLRRGEKPTNGEMSVFDSWAQVVEYSESETGGDLKPIIKAVDTYGQDRLIEMIRKLEDVPVEKANDIFATAHSSKGTEHENVRLGGDFTLSVHEKGDFNTSEAYLIYVALTRAKKNLDISNCKPLLNVLKSDTESLKKEVRKQQIRKSGGRKSSAFAQYMNL